MILLPHISCAIALNVGALLDNVLGFLYNGIIMNNATTTKIPPRLPLTACLFTLTLCLPALAQAATLNVPSSAYPTIQAAVNAAASGDTVLIANGTYTGPGNVDIDFGGKNLTVTSQNGAASTVIDCQGSAGANHRGFYLHSGETGAVISGLTIKNGYETNSNANDAGNGGGICIDGSSAVVQNCIVSGSTAQGIGGGICSTYYTGTNPSGTITLTGCTVSGNNAGEGGGVANSENYQNNSYTIT